MFSQIINIDLKMSFLILVAIICVFKDTNAFDGYTYKNKFRFPYGPIQGPFMGLFVALSLPLELPHHSVFFSYNMEANYVLPSNQSEFTYPPVVSDTASERSFDRKAFYNLLEFKLKSHGYPSRQCLLRTICEASQFTMNFTGVLGDIVHILLTPSSSLNTNLSKEYEDAEKYGRNRRHCKKYLKTCNVSLIGLVSSIGSYLENQLL